MSPLDLVVGTHPALYTRHSSYEASWLAVYQGVPLASSGSKATARAASRQETLEMSPMYSLLKSVGALALASPTHDPGSSLQLSFPQSPLEENEGGEHEVDTGVWECEVPELSSTDPRTEKQPVGSKERRRLYDEGQQSRGFYLELQDNLNELTAGIQSIRSFNETYAIIKQKEEISRFRRTGQRILCLDGGGMKGLVQIEILSRIEEETGRKIADLFDYIVGTSTGAIVALGIVYGRCACVGT